MSLPRCECGAIVSLMGQTCENCLEDKRPKCLLNCKSEGPPGPIWCTVCGHDPKCCQCEEN